MKIKVQHLLDATLVIAGILRDQNGVPRADGSVFPRPMPQKGKYRLQRIHAKLMPEFKLVNDQKDALITPYGVHQRVMVPTENEDKSITLTETDGENFIVPPDKMEEFTEAWSKITEDEIDVDVEPIPFEHLDMGNAVDGCISPAEFEALGDLIT